MADPRFFKSAQSYTLKEIAEIINAEPAPGADLSHRLKDVAPLDTATNAELSFLDNIKYKAQFQSTGAGACIVHPDAAQAAPPGVHLLLSRHPYKAYALAAQAFYPQEKPDAEISPFAHIHPSATIGKGATIEAGVVIGEGVDIGEDCWVEANTVIAANVEIGAFCRIGANATLSHCIIGHHTRLYPGVCIGQDGFGFAIDPKGHVKVPQLGRVLIGNGVEIGANTTIDRGAGPDTVIGDGTWIDNMVQIGHNVKIGRGCIIVSQTGISGSTILEDFVAIGGQVGIAGHLRIGMGARIAAKSGIMRDVPAGEEQMGYPALPIKQFMKQVALLKRLIKKDKNT
ncbi:MAG: UDP-3-O-(3-hydroxymyristoyl)glucosamine N-acyltransferase [Alphaproteobacteria bacterium]|nr:UDP-3-O-(3-hydroxymyristoyl)glucosamine N-acyltransferase [Alphaproteobacteria bacterium]